jgi:SRSO17 transposase
MNQCSQTKISRGFSLIIDDSGHRKSGNFTAGVGRQYIGEIGKTDNGNVIVTTHLYDGKKSLPLDIELYQHAKSLPQGKKDQEFKKKPELALELIDKSLGRGYRPGIVLIDSGYGNNTTFLIELEKRKLNYLGGLAKNRKVKIANSTKLSEEIRLDKLAQLLPESAFTQTIINLEKARAVWVAVVEVEISRLEGRRKIAIVMNAPRTEDADDIDYFITNVEPSRVNPQWVVDTYSQRNWVEVFYREAKGWLGLKEYQVRGKKGLKRHFILVFCAYTFMRTRILRKPQNREMSVLWHKLTGGLRRRWANKPLNTFPEAKTVISYSHVLSFCLMAQPK